MIDIIISLTWNSEYFSRTKLLTLSNAENYYSWDTISLWPEFDLTRRRLNSKRVDFKYLDVFAGLHFLGFDVNYLNHGRFGPKTLTINDDFPWVFFLNVPAIKWCHLYFQFSDLFRTSIGIGKFPQSNNDKDDIFWFSHINTLQCHQALKMGENYNNYNNITILIPILER